MNILNKLKETAISVLPVMAIVLLLGFTIVPLDKILLLKFVIGGFLLIIGLTVFLLGVDLSIQPMGERCGAELTKKKNLPLLLLIAFIIGFIVTVAEPDIQVFGDQVKSIFSFVNKNIFTFVIAGGVGLFILLGLLRMVIDVSLKWSLFILYTILFVIAFFTPDAFIGIGFDSGGATTGPMTVPFIMALGIGVASVRAGNKGSFGLTGITSIGPVISVLVYSLFIKNNIAVNTACETLVAEASVSIGSVLVDVLKESLISIAPLFAMFIVFQLFLLKMTKRQVIRMVIGFVYSYVGLAIFLSGVNFGFMQAGKALGEALGAKAVAGGFWFVLLLITGLSLGAIIVCAEPAVWCLSEQVEQVSGGTIKRKFLLIFLSVGTAIAIGLSMLRAVYGFNLKWVLVPGYIIAMTLMIFCPEMFTGIAFDSGGVASGPLTSTFVLSFTIGASSAGSDGTDSFGVIALVAMMPLIAIQLMGILFNKKTEVKNV